MKFLNEFYTEKGCKPQDIELRIYKETAIGVFDKANITRP